MQSWIGQRSSAGHNKLDESKNLETLKNIHTQPQTVNTIRECIDKEVVSNCDNAYSLNRGKFKTI